MYKYLQVHEGVHTHEISVKKDAKVTVVLTSVNVQQAEVTLRVRLVGKGASATIIGIILGDGSERITLHTMQIHEAPETTSDLLVKTVLSGHARCLYDGGIYVAKSAQKTDAYQRNENLLVSGRAYAESKPSLEILANDVRCTHGATTGPIDEDELWYLATRGITKAEGEKLITEGFIKSALDRIADRSIINELWQRLFP